MRVAMIEFRVDDRSGVPPYLQLVRQVEHAVRLGLLRGGDRLPTVKEVASQLAINPNTVLKAFRELDHRGITTGRVGDGTFIQQSVTAVPAAARTALRRRLREWLRSARNAGLSDEDIDALVEDARRELRSEGAA
jgi:GntR family transcriptional regulator